MRPVTVREMEKHITSDLDFYHPQNGWMVMSTRTLSTKQKTKKRSNGSYTNLRVTRATCVIAETPSSPLASKRKEGAKKREGERGAPSALLSREELVHTH